VQAVIETANSFRADLDPLQRPERSGKSRLHVIAHLLIPKQKKAVIFELRAHGLVGGVASGDVNQANAAYLHTKIRV
jgi:hypothetical protein